MMGEWLVMCDADNEFVRYRGHNVCISKGFVYHYSRKSFLYSNSQGKLGLPVDEL